MEPRARGWNTAATHGAVARRPLPLATHSGGLCGGPCFLGRLCRARRGIDIDHRQIQIYTYLRLPGRFSSRAIVSQAGWPTGPRPGWAGPGGSTRRADPGGPGPGAAARPPDRHGQGVEMIRRKDDASRATVRLGAGVDGVMEALKLRVRLSEQGEGAERNLSAPPSYHRHFISSTRHHIIALKLRARLSRPQRRRR